MKIYVTQMFRNGQKNKHSYVIFAGDDKVLAILAGISESDKRSGKYSAEVFELNSNIAGSKQLLFRCNRDRVVLL
ncbi:MAG: hypothetical protein GY750_06470 [Lentisphaerae bacterium]|nr:hypothetical protein [Lentisphaerota bacterium]MCP4101053.1 hypothetical protein [Lentisphaerota bacterium]